MIQFNLLPDVKLEFIRAERTKHAVVSAAIIATAVAFVIFLLLFVAVHLVQKKIMSDQTNKIKSYSNELKETKDLDKILTIQNQLGVLTELHAAKPTASRTFILVKQITPASVSLTDITIDFVAHTFSVSGTSKTLSDINTMVDTIKYTNYKTQETGAETKAFSDVVMKQFTRNATSGTFTATATYDPIIFDNANDVMFTVPKGPSTRSVVEQPQLFTNPTKEGGN